MGTMSQKMRCGNCGHTDEWEMSRSDALSFYRDAGKNCKKCPNCRQQKYALSAYSNDGLMKLKS